MSGKVFLVGAGPGDPELLTVKAARVLHQADAVLYDDLVSPEILKLVSPLAQRHNVGKRCGTKKITQTEINFLMIGLASSGLQVVRLKSGDPFVFGRLGEELAALRDADIEYEIVPGISAAFGAAAVSEIPLTHRDVSSALIFITAHRATNSEDADWTKFIASQATLVIYMPGHDYASIAARLKRAGASEETSCALISKATTAQQQVYATTIGALHQAPRLPGPTLLVVGDVVKFARFAEAPQATGTPFPGLPELNTPRYAAESESRSA